MIDGHDLSRKQIDIHGRDRYPTVGAQYAKVLDEIGELGEALIGHTGTQEEARALQREYADVGLALFELGNKLGIDLIACMASVVDGDTRNFRESQE